MQLYVLTVLLALCAAAVAVTPMNTQFYVPENMPFNQLDTEDMQFGFVTDDARILVAQHNITGNNEVFNIDFRHVVEVMGNGTRARDPIVLEGGQWDRMETQNYGGTLVTYYSQILYVDHRPVEVDIVVAIGYNHTTFFTLFGNHTLEKDEMKIGVLVNDWPFLSPENNLNITIHSWSDRHNGTAIKRDDDQVEFSEFGDVDGDDTQVLHIKFEDSCILDGHKANNVTVYQDDGSHIIYITLPHHEQYVYYDPLVTVQEPEGTGGSSSHTVLIVVLSVVGGLIVLACIVLIIFFIWRRRRQNYEIIE